MEGGTNPAQFRAGFPAMGDPLDILKRLALGELLASRKNSTGILTPRESERSEESEGVSAHLHIL